MKYVWEIRLRRIYDCQWWALLFVWSKFQKSAGLYEFSFILWNKHAYEKVFTGIKICIVKMRLDRERGRHETV